MSDLESIKSTPKAKRLLKGVHFDWSGAEITYTNGLGACSGHNDMVLAKSVDKATDLTEEQQAILSKIGKEFTPLEKSIEVGNTRETNQNQEGNEPDMSVELQKQLDEQAEQLAAMKRENAVLKATQEVEIFGLDEVVQKELIEAMVDGKGSEAIVKALTSVKAAQVVVEKEVETNPVAKALSEEAGDAGIAEEPEGPKSIMKQLEENMIAQAEGAK